MSNDRLQRFQALLADQADLAFIPLSSDLQYLTASHAITQITGIISIRVIGWKAPGSRRIVPLYCRCRE